MINIFRDIIIPPICAVCGKLNPELLCQRCRYGIEEIGEKICEYCGRPLSRVSTGSNQCNYCREESFSFYRHRSFAIYKGEIRKIIRKYKYNRVYALKEIMAAFLKQTYIKNYRLEKIDYMDTVPGEHMESLCKSLSELIGIPFAGNILKIRETLKQQSLDSVQRRVNVREAFKVKNCLQVRKKI